MGSKVYFCREITPQSLVRMYDILGVEMKGNVAVKMHSGEEGNKNYLRPEFVREVIEHINGTVVECNTAYSGSRNTTGKHIKLISLHGWDRFFPFELMDAEGPDVTFEIPDGKILKKNYVGKGILNYDSMLILSHFKGHVMGGYGGALKQLSIGCASSAGKAWIHSAGVTDDQYTVWGLGTEQDRFLESMADAAASVVRHFGENMAFINVMKNLSVDCDCDGNASPPCMSDIGVLSSLDPVAIDQACLDLVYASDDPGRTKLIQRIESRHGVHTIEAAEALGIGSREYEMICLD